MFLTLLLISTDNSYNIMLCYTESKHVLNIILLCVRVCIQLHQNQSQGFQKRKNFWRKAGPPYGALTCAATFLLQTRCLPLSKIPV